MPGILNCVHGLLYIGNYGLFSGVTMVFILMFFSCKEKESELLTEGYTSDNGFYVGYDSDPDPIPLNEEFILGVEVFSDDSMSSPSSDITVEVDATMPEHQHGMNVSPEALEVSEGRFEAEGMLFHMTGDWEIVVYVTGNEGTEDIRFNLPLE